MGRRAAAVARPAEVTKPILERYQRWLYHYRKKNGQPLSFRSQHGCLVPVRALFKWLCRQNHLLANPAADLELPRAEKRLPRHVLTAAEAERVLALPDVAEPLGLRDRAILEAFYSTGMRRMELLGLEALRPRPGARHGVHPPGQREKGPHDPDGRTGVCVGAALPGGGAAVARAHARRRDRFPDERRAAVRAEPADAARARLRRRGRDRQDRALAISSATPAQRSMLEGGADIRFIQQLLGHEKLETTQIYAQVSIRMLKEVHTRTHPARLTAEGHEELAAEFAEEEAELAE